MQHLGQWPRELLAVSSEGWEVRLFLRLTPSRMPTETKSGPKGRERGEADIGKGPVGETVAGEGPVDLHPAERPSHGRLGPVP